MSEYSKNKKENIGVRMSPEFKTKLEKVAKMNRRSLSDYIRIEMEDIINKLEYEGYLETNK